MAELIGEYSLFLFKLLSIAVVVLFVLGTAISLLRRQQPGEHGHLQVRRLNSRLRELQETMEHNLLDRRSAKARHKQRQREEKQRRKGRATPRPRAYVLDFEGDMRASQLASLRHEITAIISVAQNGEEVVLRLESPGGLVHSYGLAASQLARLREHGLRLTVAVDKVAASGGYMMACVGERIIAAPFAILGSIGVVAQIPNFRRLLQRHHVDFEQHTAGEYKRTLTMFGRNTDNARRKFREDLDDTHQLFKDFVGRYRPDLDLDKVATGEYWFGTRARELGLTDDTSTSDEYLLKLSQNHDLYEIKYRVKPSLAERFAGTATTVWQRMGESLRGEERQSRLPEA